jgi:hypothetical protein
MRRYERPSWSLPFSCALDNCDVAINREFGDTLDLPLGWGQCISSQSSFAVFLLRINAKHARIRVNSRTNRSTS